MESTINEKNAYFKGINFLDNNDYVNARHWFEIVNKYNGEYWDLSLSKLIQIDLKEGKYANARNLLRENQSSSIELKKHMDY